MDILGVSVDDRRNFDGCYITTVTYTVFVLQKVDILDVSVDGRLDFDGCYITFGVYGWFGLRKVAIWMVFVDGRLDFDGCYITMVTYAVFVLQKFVFESSRRNVSSERLVRTSYRITLMNSSTLSAMSGAPNTADPATTISTPAAITCSTFDSPMPPSISISYV